MEDILSVIILRQRIMFTKVFVIFVLTAQVHALIIVVGGVVAFIHL